MPEQPVPFFTLHPGRRPGAAGSLLAMALVSSVAGNALAAAGGLDPSFGAGGYVLTNIAQENVVEVLDAALAPDGKIVVAASSSNGTNSGFELLRFHTDGSLDLTFNGDGRVQLNPTVYDDELTSVAVHSDGSIVAVGNAGGEVAVVRYDSDGNLDPTFAGNGLHFPPMPVYLGSAQAVALQPDGKIVVAGSNFDGAYDRLLLFRLEPHGQFDSGFGFGGIVTTLVGTGGAVAESIALEPDGGIVLAGQESPGGTDGYVVAKYFADGTPDYTFGDDGVVITPVGPFADAAGGVAVQDDGKIVVVGESDNAFAVLRYHTDGSLDPGFGGDGTILTQVGSSSAAYDVAIQTDGRIVVSGRSLTNTSIAAARYNTDGSLDTSFDGDGRVFTAAGPGSGRGRAVCLQADGRIVVAGQSTTQSQYSVVVLRYSTTGALDPTLGGDGIALAGAGASLDAARAVALQGDGKIVVAGDATPVDGVHADFAVARYLGNGNLDPAFGVGGRVRTAIGFEVADVANAIAIQDDGKLVAAGGSYRDFALVRYNSDGSLDTGFDADGKVTTSFSTGIETARAVAVQDDGRIVAAGQGLNDFALARYDAGGTLDSTFDGDGLVTTPIGTGVDGAWAIALQADGKIVVAGRSALSGSWRVAVARYNTNGSLDTSFDGDGKLITSLSYGSDNPVALALAPDDKILVASGLATTIAVARFHADGTPDTTFDGDGVVTTDVSPLTEMASGITIQGDGRILVSGWAYRSPTWDFAAVRYHSDGSLDTSFDSDGIALFDILSGDDMAYGMALQPDERMILVGRHAGDTGQDFAVLRVFANDCGNGALDQDEECDDGNGVSGDCCSALCDFELAGATCGSTANTPCNRADSCDGAGSCLANLEPTTTVCRPASGACDLAENCDGSGSCAPNLFRPSGTACGSAADTACDNPDSCNGFGTCLPQYEPTSTTCRSATSTCDVAERCSGTGTCPPDGFAAAGTSCGSSADSICDDPDSCNGSGTCLPNHAPATTTCRAASGECDVVERCTGAGSCPGDAFVASGMPCGSPSDDACDDPDTCNGSGTCSTNREPSGTSCRPSNGTCDLAENCDGASPSCPADRQVSVGTSCESDGNVCTGDFCDGNGTCLHPAGTGIACDDGDACTGPDTCVDGACVAGTTAPCDDGDLCTVDRCDPITGCEHTALPVAAASCVSSGRYQLSVRAGDVPDRFQIRWKWGRGNALTPATIGDPLTSSSWALCVYDTADATPFLAFSLQLPPALSWKSEAMTSASFADRSGAFDGIQSLRVSAGDAERSKAQLKAGGAATPLPEPFAPDRLFGQEPKLVVQLVNSQGTCLTSEFEADSTRTNDAGRFKASKR